MKHVEYQGIPITIEFSKGEFKPDLHSPVPGMGWTVYADYGFFDDTVSMEPGDALDVYLGELPDCKEAYFFELLDHERAVFSEYKVCLGFENAVKAYELVSWQYSPDRIGPVLVMSLDGLKEVIQQGRMAYEKEEALGDDEDEDEQAVPLEEAKEVLDVERDVQEMNNEGYPMLKSVKLQPRLVVSI